MAEALEQTLPMAQSPSNRVFVGRKAVKPLAKAQRVAANCVTVNRSSPSSPTKTAAGDADSGVLPGKQPVDNRKVAPAVRRPPQTTELQATTVEENETPPKSKKQKKQKNRKKAPSEEDDVGQPANMLNVPENEEITLPAKLDERWEKGPQHEAVSDTEAENDPKPTSASSSNRAAATWKSVKQMLRKKTDPREKLGLDPLKGGKVDWSGGPRRKLQTLVCLPQFEAFFALLIVANTAVMAFQVQYEGFETGRRIQYPGYDSYQKDVWPGAETAFYLVDWFFGVVFSSEIVLKIIAMDVMFFCEFWNLLDLIVVVAWGIEAAGQLAFPIEPMMLRLIRLIKLLRMLRLLRTMQGFDALYLMVASVRGSIGALSWSIMLLFVLLMMVALIVATLCENYISDESGDIERRNQVYSYYGTFAKSCVSLLQMTLANWAVPSRILTEYVSEWTIVFVLCFKLTMGFSVIMVLTGVFLQVTFHVAANDDVIMVNRSERDIRTHTKKISLLMKAADEDDNGLLDIDEFQNIVEDPTVVQWLNAMGFEASHFDPEVVYKMLLPDGESELNAEQLVTGVSKLKGKATSLTLAVVSRQNNEALKRMQNLNKQLDEYLGIEGEDEEEEEDDSKEPEDEAKSPNAKSPAVSISEQIFKKKNREDYENAMKLPYVWRMQWRLKQVVRGFWFEVIFAVLIMANTCVMCAQMQYRGYDNGYRLEMLNKQTGELVRRSNPGEEVWPGASDVFEGIEIFFAAAFTVEICIKVVALGLSFPCEIWNILDTLIVAFWYVENLSTAALPVSPMMLRLFRLLRLLRMVRLMKVFEKYDALYLMMTSIKASTAALVWSGVFLSILLTANALLLTTVLEGFIRADDGVGSKKAVYELYGTFTRSMLTLWEITLGAGWQRVTHVMVYHLGEYYLFFSLAHLSVFGVAIVLVITGVFIQETMRVAQTDNIIMLNQRERDTRIHTKKMGVLFAVADEDGSGRLDCEEFNNVCRDASVSNWLFAMGIDVSDAALVHDLICDRLGTEDLDAKELVGGMSFLKGAARNVDMLMMRRNNELLRRKALELEAKVERLFEETDDDEDDSDYDDEEEHSD